MMYASWGCQVDVGLCLGPKLLMVGFSKTLWDTPFFDVIINRNSTISPIYAIVFVINALYDRCWPIVC